MATFTKHFHFLVNAFTLWYYYLEDVLYDESNKKCDLRSMVTVAPAMYYVEGKEGSNSGGSISKKFKMAFFAACLSA